MNTLVQEHRQSYRNKLANSLGSKLAASFGLKLDWKLPLSFLAKLVQ